MKAKDLRIGNLVMRENHLVNKYDKVKNHQIVVDHRDIQACVIAPEKFKPIPLTEEWLIKMGFKSAGYGCPETGYKEKFPYKISLGSYSELIIEHDFSYHIKSKVDDHIVCVNNDNVEYVHLLQNLYHSLKREELTINN